jgi:hypothetical protein
VFAPLSLRHAAADVQSATIVIPARNERGNIEAAVSAFRRPKLKIAPNSQTIALAAGAAGVLEPSLTTSAPCDA